MKQIFLPALLIATIFKVSAQTPVQEIDELLKAYTNQNSFNGVVLVAQKGNVLIEKGYGYKNATSKTFNDSNTVFQIGSITKQFTAVIILQLQEQQKLSVQDKISKYIPGFPNRNNISIENLLTHTSGIHNYSDEDFMKKNATKSITVDSLIGLLKNTTFDFQPGEKYNYSNSNYILLGYIIEKITGKSYYDVMRENIFQPLGMMHSGFDFASLKNSNKASGYIKSTTASIVDSSVSYAAGSMYSTAVDLYKWDRALYTEKIIHDSSLQKAFTPYKNNYGYGWIIDSANGKKTVMHEGSSFGFTSFMAHIPEDETCIILLDNKQSFGLPKIAENINAILNQQPYDFPKPHHEIKVDTSILRQYTGQYQVSPKFIITITLEDGQLMAQSSGQNKSELFAEKENFFFMKLTDLQIEFLKKPDGKTGNLILYQYDQKISGVKIK
jgi:CubicO group peptidase (beta-lactamase class C family)